MWKVFATKPQPVESEFSFFEATFNAADNQVVAVAVSHDGHQLAFVDSEGIVRENA